MYSTDDVVEVTKQKKSFLIKACIFTAVLLVFIIWTAVLRKKLITEFLTIIWVFVLIFFWGTEGSKIFAYNRFLRDIFNGITRECTGIWDRVSKQKVTRERIDFWEIIIISDGSERVVYYDEKKQLPDIKKGDHVAVKTFANYAIQIDKID